jgi:hypothetical protein
MGLDLFALLCRSSSIIIMIVCAFTLLAIINISSAPSTPNSLHASVGKQRIEFMAIQNLILIQISGTEEIGDHHRRAGFFEQIGMMIRIAVVVIVVAVIAAVVVVVVDKQPVSSFQNFIHI